MHTCLTQAVTLTGRPLMPLTWTLGTARAWSVKQQGQVAPHLHLHLLLHAGAAQVLLGDVVQQELLLLLRGRQWGRRVCSRLPARSWTFCSGTMGPCKRSRSGLIPTCRTRGRALRHTLPKLPAHGSVA